MHETRLAREVLDAVLARAGNHRVVAVRARLADPERLAPESLAFHFAAHARGTAAEGARLEVELTRIGARCNACYGSFETDEHVPVCPRCSSFDCQWLAPAGLHIDAMDVLAP